VSSDVCTAVAAIGRLDLLQWLRARPATGAFGGGPVPWDVETTNRAGEYGHRAVWTWAVNNGCAWDPNARRCW
jgi:hypothetical protein